MTAESKARTAPPINGHVIVLDPGRSIAIYERNGRGYVAEFRGGHESIEYASSWFRFNAGALRCLRGRAALKSFMPLNPEMLHKIEQFHAESDARQERMLSVPRTVAAAARRYWNNVISRMPSRVAKSQSFDQRRQGSATVD